MSVIQHHNLFGKDSFFGGEMSLTNEGYLSTRQRTTTDPLSTPSPEDETEWKSRETFRPAIVISELRIVDDRTASPMVNRLRQHSSPIILGRSPEKDAISLVETKQAALKSLQKLIEKATRKSQPPPSPSVASNWAVDKTMLGIGKDECPICLDEISPKDRHYFHEECVASCMSVILKNGCPLCSEEEQLSEDLARRLSMLEESE
ncbi:hypothetical protein PROFUN_03988 [Planoprotostelium fungivorum]|uniref:RING-type domain-containing protein n=1 Tax=Planoprotostelium fungivorum TaxID=1890364 RepID=A0A2P6NW24_9EUKA|nr:hypothetical protein PROFUN_03988 [Planoprotostelium fungivorum]